MKSLRRLFTRLSNSVARHEQEERLREEIAEHIALQTDANLRAGLSPAEARRQAMLKFGGVEAMKQDYRAERGLLLTPRVAIVNEQFARHYWPNADPVGKHIRIDNAAGVQLEIVGVAPTIKYQNTRERPMDMVYVPLAQHPLSRMTLMVRSRDDPLQLIQPLKDIVRTLDANLPMFETRPYEDLYLNNAVRGPQIAVDLVGAMGAAGLVLTIAGLYGLVAYNVSRRTREIGIRMALGARPSSVLRLVMGKGLVLVGIGTIFGLIMGFGVERAMNAMLFDAGYVDLVAYLIVVPSLLAATMLAAYIPARRASHISPTQALRYE